MNKNVVMAMVAGMCMGALVSKNMKKITGMGKKIRKML